ncbi:MAG: FIST C-terminal domain-containing protein [Deltaproteobacteria bacterium]|nr:FIST C-terminal domain-containing protein [Deltaproteobacteria bacterium]
MLKVLTVSTEELENPEAALRELQDGIGKAGGLRTHSVGILQCPSDFLLAGFASFLAEHLDFDFLGSTTSISSTETSSKPSQLAMMILSSDEVRFRAGLTESLSPPKGADWNDAEIRRHLDRSFLNLYRELTRGFTALPSLAVPFIPWIPGYSDQLVGRVMFGPHEGLSFFGSKAVDLYHTKRQTVPMVVYNQETSSDQAALLLCEAGLNPRFFLANLLKENINRRKAIITKSSRNTLYEVNDRPVMEFLTEQGLDDKNLPVTLAATPLVLFARDQSTHHPRVFVDRLRDGGLRFSGGMPEGMSVALAVLDSGTIVETASALFEKVAREPDVKGALFFSCLSRHVNLGWDEMREVKLLEQAWEGNPAPWLFAYSGGEICPKVLEDGTSENLFVNFTASAMVL